MSKKELIALSILIFILIAVNAVKFIQREHYKANYNVLVEEATVKIAVNSADAYELENLPGIGPSLAHRIMEYREANGGFEKLDDLKKVKGIGDKLFQKILPYIEL